MPRTERGKLAGAGGEEEGEDEEEGGEGGEGGGRARPQDPAEQGFSGARAFSQLQAVSGGFKAVSGGFKATSI
eukprot:1055015-Rhodomonas_salina.1